MAATQPPATCVALTVSRRLNDALLAEWPTEGSCDALSLPKGIEANTPGSGDYLYLKINANNNRTLRLNWWLN